MKKVAEYRSLGADEKIKTGDVIEDLETGQRIKIRSNSFFNFLKGQRANQARAIPGIYDVVRPHEQ